MNLIVRVKRRRSQEPADSICVVEDDVPRKKMATSDLARQLEGMSTTGDSREGNSISNGPRRLVLTRLGTIQTGSSTEVDRRTLKVQSSFKRGRDEEAASKTAKEPQRTDKSVWITKGKKVIREEENLSAEREGEKKKYVVVDMSQVSVQGHPNKTPSQETKTSTPSPTKSKSVIVDPATRQLGQSIEKACKTGDFNDMSAALSSGPNVNYQNKEGVTALMAAAMRCNVRMVSRLLARGADVLAVDGLGYSAQDYARDVRLQPTEGQFPLSEQLRSENTMRISLMLHSAAIETQKRKENLYEKFVADSVVGSQAAGSAGGEVNPADVGGAGGAGVVGSGNDDDDYVVDVFCQSEEEAKEAIDAAAATTSVISDRNSGSGSVSTSTASGNGNGNANGRLELVPSIPIIQIEGLHISENGNVDLVFEYDSDWSDLAEDEDPDSNDERYEGNDYPEEEEEEVEDTDDEETDALMRANIEDEDLLFEDGDDKGRGQLRDDDEFGGDEDGGDDDLFQERYSRDDDQDRDIEGELAAEEERRRGFHRRLRTKRPAHKGDVSTDSDDNDDGADDSNANTTTAAAMSVSTASVPADGTAETSSSAAPLKSAMKKPAAEVPKSNRSRLMEKLGMNGGKVGGSSRFERSGVGRVLRPQSMGWGDSGVEGGDGRVSRDSRALQKLWGQEEDMGDEYDEEGDVRMYGDDGSRDDGMDSSDDDRGGRSAAGRHNHHVKFNGSNKSSSSLPRDALERTAHRERLETMRARTGLQFASNPREFDRSGLPKYGADLSDDESDLALYQQALLDAGSTAQLAGRERLYEHARQTLQARGAWMGMAGDCQVKPSKTTVAFDPDMDLESD